MLHQPDEMKIEEWILTQAEVCGISFYLLTVIIKHGGENPADDEFPRYTQVSSYPCIIHTNCEDAVIYHEAN